MTTTSDMMRVQESLLALEIYRLHDVWQDVTVDSTQRRAAVAHAAEWLVGMWRDERLFLQKTALPLLSFYMLEAANGHEEGGEERGGGVSDAEDEVALGPWMLVFRRVIDSTLREGCGEFFVRLISIEFNTFVTVMSETDGSCEEFSNVVRCFLAVTGRHPLCVEALIEAFSSRISTKEAKQRILPVMDETNALTPSQKASFFVEICRLEAVRSVREQAARLLQSLSNYAPSAFDVVPLLADASRKVRKIAVSCLIDLGIERLREEMDGEVVAETIVDMENNVSGAQHEKKFASFMASYFATASTFDDVCRLSVLLDEVDASASTRTHEIFTHAASTALKPSMFNDHHSNRLLQ